MPDAPVLPVTLVLTTLNEEGQVARFLAGVARGSALPAQVSVCDGGSRDNTAALLRAAAIPGVSVDVRVEPGATIARGRNVAVRGARYDILAVTDAGCDIDREWLARITEPLRARDDVDAVAGGYELAGDNVLQRCTAAAHIPPEHLPPADFLPSSRSFALRRAAFDAAGGYDETLSFAGEDTALCLRMRALGMRFETRFDARVRWDVRPTLRALLRQHYLYGVGDGEAGSFPRKYRTIAMKLGGLLTTLLLGLAQPLFLLLFLLALTAYAAWLWPKYAWSRVPPHVALGAFGVVLAKEAAMFAGQVTGRLNRMDRADSGRAKEGRT